MPFLLPLLLCLPPSSSSPQGGEGMDLGIMDGVRVSMNKVWPFANPTETYRFYDFPFCRPSEIMPEFMTFGQILRGDRLVNSVYAMDFKESLPETVVCNKTLSSEDLKLFQAAIDESYMFEMFVSGLPVVRPFGVKSIEKMGGGGGAERALLLAQLLGFCDRVGKEREGYNGDSIVSVKVTTDLDLHHIVDISGTEPLSVSFSYSVQWEESDIPPSRALEKQMKSYLASGGVSPHSQSMDIHWLAIINSFVLMLLILSLLLLIIVRVVRSDLTKYLQIPDEELASVEDESGWKLLHGDVFRAPQHRLFLAAGVGAGAQLGAMIVMVVVVGFLGVYYQRGGVVSASVLFYMVTAAIAGYVSARLYKKMGGEKWAWNIFVTAMAFTGPSFLCWSFLNTVAISYNSTAAFPFPTILLIFGMWACVTFPLTVLGGVLGKNGGGGKGKGGFPCKTNKLAREIPSVRWYQSPLCQVFTSGFLPFSAIYIELHYIFHSVWGPKIYSLYGILFLAFLMLVLISVTLTVLFTYFHLNAEDYRWWWRSFLSGGSVSAFFYAYCVYFYVQTPMTGFLQSSFFFLYSLLIGYGLLLMLGSLSFGSTYCFVVGIKEFKGV